MENIYKLLSGVTDRMRKMKKNLGKYALSTILLLGGIAYSNSTKAQDDSYKRNWPIMDFYSRPNIVQGESKGKLEYVGSGDVNNDGIPNEKDINLIYSGTKNDMAKIQGNENITATDASILGDYVSGNSDLPGDWDRMNKLEGVDSETGYNKRYVEKVKWLEKRILPNQIHEFSVPGECEIFSKNYFFNLTGIANFENYVGTDDNEDGALEGYNEYSKTVNIGHENIPTYLFSVTKKNGENHAWPGVFVGEKELGKEDNPLELDNFYIFDYGNNGERILPGDYGIDENKPVTVYTLSWNPVTQQHEITSLIPFNLKDGVATVDTLHVDKNVMFQNPHTAIVDLSEKQDIIIEADGSQPDFSEDKIGKPSLETNLKAHYVNSNYRWYPELGPSADYTPTVTYEDSEFKEYDSRYPAYGELTRKYVAGSTMGRWDPSNEPALGDTTEFKIIVDDTTAPEIALKQNSIEGEKGSDPEELTKSLVNYVSDASTSYGYPLDTIVTGTQNPSFEDNTYYYYDTNISVKDVRGNVSTSENVEVKVKKNKTGIDEAIMQGGFDAEQNYPNPVISETTVPYAVTKPGKVFFEIWGQKGQLLEKKLDYAPNAGEYKFKLNMQNYIPGTYLLRVSNEDGKFENFQVIKQ